MKALTSLAQFPFSYLSDGYLPYLWLVVAVLVFVGIVVLFERRPLKHLGFWKANPKFNDPQFVKKSAGSSDSDSLEESVESLKNRQEVLDNAVKQVQVVQKEMQGELARLKLFQDQSKHEFDQKQKEEARVAKSHGTEDCNFGSNSPSKPGNRLRVEDDGQLEHFSEMKDLYNASRKDQSIRSKFREKYKPFSINVTNDVDRRRNTNLQPDFRAEDDGSYLAVLRENDEAAIFPNFTLVVVDAVYGPGALSEVFDCGTFDRGFSYSNIRVDVPATFKFTGGQSWRVIHKGKLDLGAGQDD